jgi:hypothetical protein
MAPIRFGYFSILSDKDVKIFLIFYENWQFLANCTNIIISKFGTRKSKFIGTLAYHVP